jgi:serine/threonine protein kinase
MGLDDVLRLGHLVLAIDQTSDRPKSRTTLLDYMAPEMLSIRPHNEHELALLDGSDSEDDSSSSSSSSSSNGSRQHTPPQQRWEFLQEPAQVPLDQLGLLGARQQASPASVRAAQADRVLNLDEDSMADLHKPHHSQQRLSAGQQQQQQQQQHGNWMQQPAQLDPSRQVSLDPAALEQLGEAAASAQPQVQSAFQAAALQPDAAADRLEQHERAGRRGSKAFLGPCVRTDRAEWEYQDHYDEKVDIWQLGCMLHELLCGSMPFEVRGMSLAPAMHGTWPGQALAGTPAQPCCVTMHKLNN